MDEKFQWDLQKMAEVLETAAHTACSPSLRRMDFNSEGEWAGLIHVLILGKWMTEKRDEKFSGR